MQYRIHREKNKWYLQVQFTLEYTDYETGSTNGVLGLDYNNEKNRQILIVCLIIIAIIFITALTISISVNLVTVNDFSDIDVVGVIDDSLYLEPSNNVIYNGDIIDDGESHGAEILEYLKDIGYSNSIFYYSAERDGIIESNSIVEGLNWMKQNKVKRINISLSSKKRVMMLRNGY